MSLTARERAALKRKGTIRDGELRISTSNTEPWPVEVLAAMSGLAVHPAASLARIGQYTLTHVASGMYVAHFQSLRNAKAAMRAVSRLMPWRSSGAVVVRAPAAKVTELAKRLSKYGGTK